MYDILIIGGGINGTAIARDAAGRGIKVILLEQNDLASATSSASTKLIHGGLRYLEQFEFKLVREALIEREVMLDSAPHIIKPVEFVIPHNASHRPKWLIRLGLWLYDHLAQRKTLPASRSLKLQGTPQGLPLADCYTHGFTYSDCWVDDSRLVVLNARDAADRGAEIKTQTKVISAERHDNYWTVVTDRNDNFQARTVINAAGPWVSNILDQVLTVKSSKRVRLVKGSHIVVNQLYQGDHAYLFQNSDRRVIFAVPFQEHYTLIGTTDVDWQHEPGPVVCSNKEQNYLISAVNQFLRTPVTESSVILTFAGLRPLFDSGDLNASVVTRDYAFDLNQDAAPVLSIFGGKITTARKLAEHAIEHLNGLLPTHGPAWTKNSRLPGGNIPNNFIQHLITSKPFLSQELATRLAESYGSCVSDIIKDAQCLEDLGMNFGHDLTQAEVDYLINREWAITAEDILWRRTKLGIKMSLNTQLAQYIETVRNNWNF